MCTTRRGGTDSCGGYNPDPLDTAIASLISGLGLDKPVLSGTDFSYFFGAYGQSGREDGNDPFCPPHQVILLVSIALPLIITPDTEDAHVLRIRQHIEGMLACSRAAAGDPWSIRTRLVLLDRLEENLKALMEMFTPAAAESRRSFRSFAVS